MSKYLVTGACGFTGSHTVDYLIEKGIDVVATDLESADKKYLNPEAKFIPADITEKESIKKAIKGVDYILHTAAIFNFCAPMSLLKKVNVEGTKNICEIALEEGVKRLVSWSTCGVYGKITKTPIKEDHPKNPVENYSKTKLEQDEVVKQFYKEKGLPITIVRPGLVYGPRSKYGMGLMIIGLSKAPILPIPINFTFNIAPIHAKDVGSAAYHLSTIPQAIGEEYHVVDNSKATMAQFLQLTASLLGKISFPVYVPQSSIRRAIKIISMIPQEKLNKITFGLPLLEKPTLNYFPIDLNVSNEKLTSTGYKFLYPDYRIGLIETIDWMKREKVI